MHPRKFSSRTMCQIGLMHWKALLLSLASVHKGHRGNLRILATPRNRLTGPLQGFVFVRSEPISARDTLETLVCGDLKADFVVDTQQPGPST